MFLCRNFLVILKMAITQIYKAAIVSWASETEISACCKNHVDELPRSASSEQLFDDN